MPRLLVVSLLGLVLALGAPAQEPLAPASALRHFEAALRTLAKEGRRDAIDELLPLLERLGLSESRRERLRSDLDRRLDKSREPREGSRTRALKSLERALSTLESELAQLPEDRRLRLARILLNFDPQHEAANLALGRQRVRGRFVEPERLRLVSRRAELDTRMRRLRKLPVPIELGVPKDPILEHFYEGPAALARWNDWQLSTCWSQEKAERALRESIRAWILGRSLQGHELELPNVASGWRWTHVHSHGLYKDAIDFALARSLGDAESAERARAIACWDGYRNGMLLQALTEAGFEAALLFFTSDSLPLPMLTAGQLNWIGLHYLGASMPRIAHDDSEQDEAKTVSRGGADAERDEMLRLRSAGAAGSRAYLAWLVSRGEDPSIRSLLDDHVGKITEDRLLKASFVYEYLQLRGEPERLLRPHRAGPSTLERKEQLRFLEAELEQRLEDFDDEWRAWMRPQDEGLLARLDPQPDPAAGKAGERVLTLLQELRNATFKKAGVRYKHPLRIDPELSRGCRAHARYLAKNPEQGSAWPDAHEEWPDREGFSPEGARAGGSSVIAGGVSDMQAAIDGWMGTFYHRLPLIEPGVVRIGWGLEGKTALLDMSSMRGGREPGVRIRYPYPDQKNVPLRFRPELPNPVPGREEGQLGYPVTLMLGPLSVEQRSKQLDVVELELFRKDGSTLTPVACHVSSPMKPSNPVLAPRDTWCLMPKAHLEANTEYVVKARSTVRKLELEWSFRTGSR